jgi:hypothetical protein
MLVHSERTLPRHRIIRQQSKKRLPMNTSAVLLPRVAAGILLAGILTAGSAGTCSAQTGERPFIHNVTPPGTARTRRLRVPNDFFRQDAVHFARALIDAGGMIRADGHNLNLYGAVLVPRNKICTSDEGIRWACGQRAFVALRNFLDGQPITCSFMHASVPPKAICLVRDRDVTEFLLGEGWAELADGVADEAYVDAQASAQDRKSGIWGDGAP